MTSPRPYAEIIGDPIDHVKAPHAMAFWLKATGTDAEYRAKRVARSELAKYVADRRADPSWLGCNVTMPLKLDALLMADQTTDRAAASGAAGLLLARDGKILAGNADVGAVALCVARLAQGTMPDNGITLLGSGGGARAALVALRTLGIGPVQIQSRDIAEARKVAIEFALGMAPNEFDMPIRTTGLINATPMGMIGQPNFELDIAAMPGDGWVLDFVTAPAETSLVRRARAQGLDVLDGIDLLVEQAAASFELFFGQAAPRDRDEELKEQLR